MGFSRNAAFLTLTITSFSRAASHGAPGAAAITAPVDSPFAATSHAPNDIALIANGKHALAERLKAIEDAKTGIDMMYYLFETDETGQIVLQTLAKKIADEKKQGRNFKVRIIVDYYNELGRPGINSNLAAELGRLGIEVRYYNVAEVPEIWKVGHRNHSKLFIADRNRVIMGGRNIENEYFDVNTGMNWSDADISVHGPIVASTSAAFDYFWNSKFTRELPPKPRADLDTAAKDVLKPSPYLDGIKKNVFEQAAKSVAEGDGQTQSVHDISWYMDEPGQEKSHRVLSKEIYERLAKSKDVSLSNCIFFVKKDEKKVFENILQKGGHVSVVTNGYDSESNDALATFAQRRKLYFVQKGMKVFHYKGAPSKDDIAADSALEGTQRSIHSKLIIFDNKDVFIGSPNVDPRSTYINVEAGFMVHDSPDFAAETQKKINGEISNSRELLPDGNEVGTSTPAKKAGIWDPRELWSSQY